MSNNTTNTPNIAVLNRDDRMFYLFFSSPGYGETKIPPFVHDGTPMANALKHLANLLEKTKPHKE